MLCFVAQDYTFSDLINVIESKMRYGHEPNPEKNYLRPFLVFDIYAKSEKLPFVRMRVKSG